MTREADRQLQAALVGRGWRVVRTRGHTVMRCPCGEHQATLAVTSGDRRSYKNMISTLRRMGCPSLQGWQI